MGGSWAAIAGDTRSSEKSGSSMGSEGGAEVVIEGIVRLGFVGESIAGIMWCVLVGESTEMEGMGEMGETMWFVVGRESAVLIEGVIGETV